jgi:hypothetical protein
VIGGVPITYITSPSNGAWKSSMVWPWKSVMCPSSAPFATTCSGSTAA